MTSNRGSGVNIAYMGGEPLMNRALVREVTEYASGTATAARAPTSAFRYHQRNVAHG